MAKHKSTKSSGKSSKRRGATRRGTKTRGGNVPSARLRKARASKKKSREGSVLKVEPLANYLVTEAEREIAQPDAATRRQLSLINTEAATRRGKKSGAGGKRRERR